MKISRRCLKAGAADGAARAPRAEEPGRRFIRDARPPAQSSGSGLFWYRIWRSFRAA